MNLFSQLSAASRCAPASTTPVAQHLKGGAAAKARKAFELYRDAMRGKGWLAQFPLEQSLGYSRNGSSHMLKRLLEDGHVVRRPKGNAAKFRYQDGYEWLWVSGETKTHREDHMAMVGNGWMTRDSISKALGLTGDGVKYYLAQLLSTGDVERRAAPGKLGVTSEWRWGTR